MDEKSEEELERIANLVTAEMIRKLNAPKGQAAETDSEDDGGDGAEGAASPEEG